jgi:hypothetical protein
MRDSGQNDDGETEVDGWKTMRYKEAEGIFRRR